MATQVDESTEVTGNAGGESTEVTVMPTDREANAQLLRELPDDG